MVLSAPKPITALGLVLIGRDWAGWARCVSRLDAQARPATGAQARNRPTPSVTLPWPEARRL